MRSLFFKIVFLLAMFCSTSLHAFFFDKGKHAFIFDSDTSIFVNPTTDNYDLTGFGYYINGDDTFYAITESDINKALSFKEGDEVRFVKKHNENAELKVTLFKVDKDDHHNNIYKIAGKGNGNIQFTVVPKPYQPSGQPLPTVIFTAFFGVFSFMLVRVKLNKKQK